MRVSRRRFASEAGSSRRSRRSATCCGSAVGVPLDLVISPVALDQLEQAEDGYERSDGTSVPRTRPPARSTGDAGPHPRDRGVTAGPAARDAVRRSEAPGTPVLGPRVASRCPVAAGRRDLRTDPGRGSPTRRSHGPRGSPSIRRRSTRWRRTERTTILGAADSVERPPQDNDFAPPPAATLFLATGGDVTLLLPDPGATIAPERPRAP